MSPQLATRKLMSPYIKDDIEYYQHQVEGIRKMARMRSFLLADDMGLGKTLQVLTVFEIDVKKGLGNTMIVVSPNGPLKDNWTEEIDRFTGARYVYLDGSPSQREALIHKFVDMEAPYGKILIVNYEQVASHLTLLNSIKFHMACFDEAHYLKNPKSKRTKACHKLVSKRSALLTGTPMLNRANELWSLLHRIAPNTYSNYWTFVNRYCVFGGFKDKQIIGVKNEAELRAKLGDIMIRRLKKDVLDLPEVQIIIKRVALSKEQRDLYNQATQDLELPQAGETDPMVIENAMVKFLRLKQILGTTLPFTGVDISSKLDQVIEDDTELLTNGHKVVVWTQFRDVLECYATRMRKVGWPVYELHGDVKARDRKGVLDNWRDHPGPAVLVCMLQVAGVGLNMTASRHAAFVDKLFVPGLNQQAIDRQNRIGADLTQPIQVRDYRCKDTIDTRVETILNGKIVEANAIVEFQNKFGQRIDEMVGGGGDKDE